MADEVLRLADCFKFSRVRLELLREALHASKDVAFADLTAEQKATLKGAAVGEAIDELRLRKLHKLEFVEKLRGK